MAAARQSLRPVRRSLQGGDSGGLVVSGARAKVLLVACEHPPEERKAVYAGGLSPLRDRSYCGLCGEVLVIEVVVTAARPGAIRRGA